MRTQEALIIKRDEMREELRNNDFPQEIENKLEAQAEILNWVIEGDVLPDEYLIEGRLKMSGEFFEKVILAGVDSAGTPFPAATVEEEGQYFLARRPTPEELDKQRKM
jgi:hypothetical protein